MNFVGKVANFLFSKIGSMGPLTWLATANAAAIERDS
jgi:hypothetical protein